jgi:hypothetical protein
MPVRLELTTGEAHDNRFVTELLSDLNQGAVLLVIEDTMRTGSEHSPVNTVRGPTFLSETQRPFVFSHICTGRAIWRSASSTGSSNAGASLPGMTNSRQTTLPSSSSQPFRIWLRAFYESYAVAMPAR